MQEIQSSLRDGGVVLQSLSDELKRATTKEREDIHSLYTSLYETIRTQYEGTMRTIDGYVGNRKRENRTEIERGNERD